MFAKAYSFGINGLDAYCVTIETDLSDGLPCFTLVGLPDNAVKESRERVRTAIKHCGQFFPEDRITVNLAPADMKKQGPGYEAAIALSVLAASQTIDPLSLKDIGIIGELSLYGELKSVPGVLAMALACKAAGFTKLFVPSQNAAEAALVDDLPIYAANHLSDLITWLQDPKQLPAPFKNVPLTTTVVQSSVDFADVKGQQSVKRGLEVAAAGGHNVLICGSPGSGKTMLARRLSTILPPLTLKEALEVTRIHSVVGQLSSTESLVQTRPIRSPHHTASNIALIGGGSIPKPGEVTLAHHGILFLDELPEFSRHVLETLRQPLEEGHVTIARAKGSVKFPAHFMLVAAMNPCPCGFKQDPKRPCRCTPTMIDRYQQKISGPLLDRIDLYLNSPALKPEELLELPTGEPSMKVRKRTCNARNIQQQRFNNTSYTCNAHIDAQALKKYCTLDDACKKILAQAVKQLNLSARAHDRILRVARTIADLDNQENISPLHLAEAISYRDQTRS